MKTAKEIRNCVENLRYYQQQISVLVRQQINTDVAKGQELGTNTGAGSIRFDSLGAIDAAAGWIEVYCENILANLKVAEAQDKMLHEEEEVNEPET